MAFFLYHKEISMKLKKIILGEMQTNCYILIQEESHECIVIDPGSQGQKVSRYIDNNELRIKGVLLTHGHFDHIGAVDYLYEKYHCPIYTHAYTCDLLKDSYLNLSENFGNSFTLKAPIQTNVDHLCIAGFQIQWLLLEGHCQGSSMIYIPEHDLIFSGDVLFQGSIGRFDFPTSSHHETKNTLHKIKNMTFDARILPGHGEETTLLNEQKNNPYLQ